MKDGFLLPLYFIIISHLLNPINSTTIDTIEVKNSLAGKFLEICCTEQIGAFNWKRNKTGHTIAKNGIMEEMLDWLSLAMKFKYECFPQKEDEMFTTNNVTKTKTYTTLYRLKAEECSLSPVAWVINYDRFKEFNFLSPIFFGPYKLLLPSPSTSNIASFSKVWVALVVSLAATITLSLIEFMYSKKADIPGVSDVDLHWLFVFGLLVSKSGFKAPNKLKMRLVGGAWCIGALILTNYYSSALTSLITVSVPQLLVNSVEELAHNDNIGLVVLKENYMYTNVILRSETPVMKKLNDKLKTNPNSLCSNTAECVRQVVNSRSTTFLHNNRELLGLVADDFRKTGKCNLAIAKEAYGMFMFSWPLSKHDPNFEMYQQGTLRMHAAGLVNLWLNRFAPMPSQCMTDPTDRKEIIAQIRNPSLVNLKNLYSAFLYLLLGFTFSFIALLIEWVRKFWERLPH